MFVSQETHSDQDFEHAGPELEEDHFCFLQKGDRDLIQAHLQSELTQGVHALRDVLRGQKLNLLEVCAPWDSPLTSAVRELGGKAVSIGIHPNRVPESCSFGSWSQT